MSKKITYKMIASEKNSPVVTECEFVGKNRSIAFDVKSVLNIEEASEFVASINTLCANVDSGEYRPETMDFAIRICTLASYAGIPIPDVDGIDEAYVVVYDTDIFDKVMAVINKVQHEALVSAAIKKIEFSRDTIVSASVVQLNKLIQKMDEVMMTGEEVVQRLSGDEMKAQLEALAKIAGVNTPGQAAQVDVPDVIPFPVGVRDDDAE